MTVWLNTVDDPVLLQTYEQFTESSACTGAFLVTVTAAVTKYPANAI